MNTNALLAAGVLALIAVVVVALPVVQWYANNPRSGAPRARLTASGGGPDDEGTDHDPDGAVHLDLPAPSPRGARLRRRRESPLEYVPPDSEPEDNPTGDGPPGTAPVGAGPPGGLFDDEPGRPGPVVAGPENDGGSLASWGWAGPGTPAIGAAGLDGQPVPGLAPPAGDGRPELPAPHLPTGTMMVTADLLGDLTPGSGREPAPPSGAEPAPPSGAEPAPPSGAEPAPGAIAGIIVRELGPPSTYWIDQSPRLVTFGSLDAGATIEVPGAIDLQAAIAYVDGVPFVNRLTAGPVLLGSMPVQGAGMPITRRASVLQLPGAMVDLSALAPNPTGHHLQATWQTTPDTPAAHASAAADHCLAFAVGPDAGVRADRVVAVFSSRGADAAIWALEALGDRHGPLAAIGLVDTSDQGPLVVAATTGLALRLARFDDGRWCDVETLTDRQGVASASAEAHGAILIELSDGPDLWFSARLDLPAPAP